MSNYEKARLANGSIYEIIPGGLRESSDKSKLIIVALMGNRTLSDVDQETDISDNIKTITILDNANDEIDIKKGYMYQTGCKKQKNYVIGRKEVETGEVDAEGNAITEYQDITETVVVIELETGNIRAELDEAKTEIADLSATIDILLIKELEG